MIIKKDILTCDFYNLIFIYEIGLHGQLLLEP